MNDKNGLKKIALWQWGLIAIFAGIFAHTVMGMLSPSGGSAAAKGQAFGRAAAAVFFVVVGIILIIVDFVRRRQ